jgi:hypothetical protein
MTSATLVLPHEIGPGPDREVQILLADRWRKLVLIQLRLIVVLDLYDLKSVASGANLISLLRKQYEIVRLDLQHPKS